MVSCRQSFVELKRLRVFLRFCGCRDTGRQCAGTKENPPALSRRRGNKRRAFVSLLTGAGSGTFTGIDELVIATNGIYLMDNTAFNEVFRRSRTLHMGDDALGLRRASASWRIVGSKMVRRFA